MGTIQDGRSLTSRVCSSQGRRGELEDATLSDKVWSLTEQKIPSGGNTRVARTTLVAGAVVMPATRRGSSRSRVNTFGGPARAPSTIPEPGAAAVTAPWCGSARRRVNGTGCPSDRGLESWVGRVAYYGHKKEARQENPGQKSTISFNAAALALGTNNLDVHSRDLI